MGETLTAHYIIVKQVKYASSIVNGIYMFYIWGSGELNKIFNRKKNSM